MSAHDHGSHTHNHTHTHTTPAGPGRERRLTIAIVLNVAIVITQVVAGIASGSIGLLADAAHNLTDVLAIIVALIAVRLAQRPINAVRSYGYHRAGVIAALFNAAMILAVCGYVLIEAVQRLRDPQPIDGVVVIAAAFAGAAVNATAAAVVYDRSSDINMRGALLHLVSDALTSVAVAASGIVMFVSNGWYWLDPAIAIVVSLLIAWQGWRLALRATDILLESTPVGLGADAVTAAMIAVPGVEAVHDLHIWSLSSELNALSAHVVLTGNPTLESAQVVAATVKSALREGFHIDHATLELESNPCEVEPGCHADPALTTRTLARPATKGRHT